MFGYTICQNPPGRFRRFNGESYFSRWKEIFPSTTNLSPTAVALWLGVNLFYLLHYKRQGLFSSFLACASVGLHPLKCASFSASSKPSKRDLSVSTTWSERREVGLCFCFACQNGVRSRESLVLSTVFLTDFTEFFSLRLVFGLHLL